MTEIPRPSPEGQPTISIPEIDRRLKALKRFETDLQNPEVEKARAAIRQIVGSKMPWFNEHDIAVIYHGSLQYNDPRNLDVDLVFIGEPPHFDELNSVKQELEDAFTQSGAWPRYPCETNFGYASLELIRRELELTRHKKDQANLGLSWGPS